MTSISVLVPCYNDGRWIVECIASIQGQTYPAYEIIIVDDGSTDAETKAALESLKTVPRVTVLEKPNGGVSSARNLALSAAKGDYVLFLDADDYLEKNALQLMKEASEAAQAEFVQAGWRDVHEDGRPMRSTAPHKESEDAYTSIATSGAPVGGVLLKRRPDLRFKDTMPWEALEYFLDYVSVGGGAVFIDDIVVNCRQSERAERLTNKLNHFEPFRMGQFFAERKNALSQRGMATAERVSALDRRILNCVHSLLRQRRYHEADILAEIIERPLLNDHPAYRLGSFAWTFRWGGSRGARLFVHVNRLIGRA